MGLSYTKWNKYKVLREEETLVPFLPETTWYTPENLQQVTEQHNELIVKPSGAYGGNGVMMISKQEVGTFRLQAGKEIVEAADYTELEGILSKRIGRGYIIQKRIDLATINGRLFDLRVMVQRRTKQSKWKVTGMLAKVGGKGFIITNTKLSGGYVLTAETAISRSNIPLEKQEELLQELRRVAYQTVKKLQRSYGYITAVGIDFGVDAEGKIWIIEANFAPSVFLFNKLKDKTMFRRVLAYKKI
jgi:glutathione synthase/RimK-type ligase-like ATP-grasp enzyme